MTEGRLYSRYGDTMIDVYEPSGKFYCRFKFDDNQICIVLENGYRVFLDRQVEPYLKKFLECLELDRKNKNLEKRV
jgi:hypothetical protein